MKLLLLQLAALSSAFVLPNEQLSSLRHVQIESARAAKSALHRLPSKSDFLNDLETTFEHISDEIEHTFEHVSGEVQDKFDEYSEKSTNLVDDSLAAAHDIGAQAKASILDTYIDARHRVESAAESLETLHPQGIFGHHGGHHGGHHSHKPNMTLYQLLNTNKYITKFVKLVDKYPDLVGTLNGTAANYTLFAPTDDAVDKLLEHHKEPPKKVLEKILNYHVSPEYYPAKSFLSVRTVPTLFKSKPLGVEPMPQRLSTQISLRGLTINYISRVVGLNLFGTNGVIHAVDALILPPPLAVQVIDFIPSELSTLELGLIKTGLFDQLNTTKHYGGTMFAPENHAFAKLGHEANAFLFSSWGRKYLRALLEYHIVPANTLYSDAFYKKSSSEATSVPKGVFHVDLPTLLEDRSLSIDIARYARLFEIKINAFARVEASDAVCADGVIHIVGDVLVPPKRLANGEMQHWNGVDELTVDDLKARLEPLSADDSHWDDL